MNTPDLTSSFIVPKPPGTDVASHYLLCLSRLWRKKDRPWAQKTENAERL